MRKTLQMWTEKFRNWLLWNARAFRRKSVSGHWVGYYLQSGVERAISAHFTQTGDRIKGAMVDAETEFKQTVAEMAFLAGLPPGADETIVKNIREKHPNHRRAPIRFLVTIPQQSILEGVYDEGAVTFWKTYQGESFSGFTIGPTRVGETTHNHRVKYSGSLSPDGDRLEGKWSVDDKSGPPTGGRALLQGSFLLERKSR